MNNRFLGRCCALPDLNKKTLKERNRPSLASWLTNTLDWLFSRNKYCNKYKRPREREKEGCPLVWFDGGERRGRGAWPGLFWLMLNILIAPQYAITSCSKQSVDLNPNNTQLRSGKIFSVLSRLSPRDWQHIRESDNVIMSNCRCAGFFLYFLF